MYDTFKLNHFKEWFAIILVIIHTLNYNDYETLLSPHRFEGYKILVWRKI